MEAKPVGNRRRLRSEVSRSVGLHRWRQGNGVRNGSSGLPNEDPLGRAQRNTRPDLGSSVKVPDEIDTQRAREILDAIRRRLGEGGRPAIERDYLERLLDRL